MAGHDLSEPEVASIVGEARMADFLAERIEALGGEAIVQECGDRWTTGDPPIPSHSRFVTAMRNGRGGA